MSTQVPLSTILSLVDGSVKRLALQESDETERVVLSVSDGPLYNDCILYKPGFGPANWSQEEIDANAADMAYFLAAKASGLATNRQIHGSLRDDGATYAVPRTSGFGMVMNERDFRINTGVLSAADSLEDVYFDPADMKQKDWDELSLVGCYKEDGSGGYTPCTNQADADANAVLSIWDYVAKMPDGTPIRYELRDGFVLADPSIFAVPSAPTAFERFGHRAYCVLAPNILGSLGGCVAIFDGYLGRDTTLRLHASSPQTHILDPTGPAGLEGSRLRIGFFYPTGTKHSHTLSLVAYRVPGTFH